MSIAQRVLITGGAGFIGSHAARHFSNKGWHVAIVDTLARKGTRENLAMLLKDLPSTRNYAVDIRDPGRLQQVFQDELPDLVLHLAGQVAVTWSVEDPRNDFEVNALGTFNVLEAVRLICPNALLIYSSTNKVYGGLESREVSRGASGYQLADLPNGVSESEPLDFHSPYGCSKGAADQYVRDYGRIYGLRTLVARQSCIYGTYQYGVEDQGWIAWMTIAAMLGKPITVFGDGDQVRDVLFVKDLVKLYEQAAECYESGMDSVYNVGGGPANRLSINSLLDILAGRLSRPILRRDEPWRPGDQRVYVSDIRHARKVLGWAPGISINEGLEQLITWVERNRELIESLLRS